MEPCESGTLCTLVFKISARAPFDSRSNDNRGLTSLTMTDSTRPELQDSVYIGDTHHGTVVHQQHIHHHAPQNPVQTVVHHVYPQSPTGHPSPEAPRRQIWFFGRRIWNPQMGLITISIICILGLIWIIPILPAIIGIAVAGLAIKNGDIRGIIPILIGILVLLISISTL